MKIKFNSDDELALNKTIEIPSIVVVVRLGFYKNNKCYPQVFLEECLYVVCKFLCFTCFFINNNCITVSIYWYVMKYRAKQKHLLPCYVRTTNQ